MAHNKIVLAPTGEVLIDLSQDTATEEFVIKGKTFHKSDGTVAEGTLIPELPENLDSILTEQSSYIEELKGILEKKSAGDSGSGSGNISVALKDVNLYDYDGTLLHSYTLQEMQDLVEFFKIPPAHKGLTFQGWNWLAGGAILCNRGINIGASYITDDAKTRLYIKIAENVRMTVPFQFSQTKSDGVTVDWGDGSDTETVSITGFVSTSHTYTNIGDYVISLEVAEGCKLTLMGDSSSSGIFGSVKAHSNMLQKVEMGNKTDIGSYAFKNCYSLSTITIPNGVSRISSYAFQNCYSLSSIVIPKSVFDIQYSAFQDCHSLSLISLPYSVVLGHNALLNCYSLSSITVGEMHYISSAVLQNCYSLSSIVIPNNVIDIDNNAFSGCSSMTYFDFTSHTSVPRLASSNAFDSIPSDCEIRVPAWLYNEWIAATNWSSLADKIVAV